jgi:hypothetical protein
MGASLQRASLRRRRPTQMDRAAGSRARRDSASVPGVQRLRGCVSPAAEQPVGSAVQPSASSGAFSFWNRRLGDHLLGFRARPARTREVAPFRGPLRSQRQGDDYLGRGTLADGAWKCGPLDRFEPPSRSVPRLPIGGCRGGRGARHGADCRVCLHPKGLLLRHGRVRRDLRRCGQQRRPLWRRLRGLREYGWCRCHLPVWRLRVPLSDTPVVRRPLRGLH